MVSCFDTRSRPFTSLLLPSSKACASVSSRASVRPDWLISTSASPPVLTPSRWNALNPAATPPSLVNMYKELEEDIPGFKRPGHGHLQSWAEQGVLLLNAVLTVEHKKANSHKGKVSVAVPRSRAEGRDLDQRQHTSAAAAAAALTTLSRRHCRGGRR